MILEEIPLLPDTTDQLLSVVLSGNPYTLRVLWNENYGYFSLSVLERDGSVILENIKMVKNYPLVSRFRDVRLPVGELFFIDNRGRNVRPVYESIGTGDYSLVYFVPTVLLTPERVVITPVVPTVGSIWDSGLSVWDGGATLWDGA